MRTGQNDSGGPPAGEERLEGTIQRVTYRHPESGYSVLRVLPEAGFEDPSSLFAAEQVTAVGTLPTGPSEPGEGLRIRLTGAWGQHPQHGRQFRFELAEVLPPRGREGLVRYLASPVFRGVGPTLAERIVETLGPGALESIREDPACLERVRGLTSKVAEELAHTVRAELGTHEALAFLLGIGLGSVQAARVLRALGPEVEQRLRDDPYVLSHGIRGIGFLIADRVARHMGVAEDAPERRRAALLHSLSEATKEGHVLLEAPTLQQRAAQLIDRPLEEAQADLEQLAEERQVVLEPELRAPEELVYLPPYHTAETGLARNLGHLLRARSPGVRPLADADRLARVEREDGIDLHAAQRQAVLGLLREPVGLLTGGPGVGKTTIIRLVVGLAEGASARVVLASPTGRAAKRLAEATGREASTVHRLLGWEPRTGRFAHSDREPLEADLVIVDEISMLDVILAHHLVKAIQPPTRLLLIGDPDQLPSVSPGNVLADLLASEQVPAFRLTKVYRQAAESLIVANAHRLLHSEMPHLPGRDDPQSDFYFFGAEGEQETAERLIDVVSRRIPARFGMDASRDVQVLSPMYRGPCGVDALNERLREAQGIGGRELRWRERTWRVGDRVIHTRNDYERNVFNGDMGILTHIDENGQGLTVRFPEREVRYTSGEFSDLQPAFAITVHRSQGGEFPCVVMPLVMAHFAMLQRHLLYTAITRAKRLVVLVGSKRALQRAVENAEVAERKSALADRLRALALD